MTHRGFISVLGTLSDIIDVNLREALHSVTRKAARTQGKEKRTRDKRKESAEKRNSSRLPPTPPNGRPHLSPSHSLVPSDAFLVCFPRAEGQTFSASISHFIKTFHRQRTSPPRSCCKYKYIVLHKSLSSGSVISIPSGITFKRY